MKLKQVKELEQDIANAKDRLNELEKFRNQIECKHPIQHRKIVFTGNTYYPWVEECAICGKRFKHYDTRDEALTAERWLLQEKIKANESELQKEGVKQKQGPPK